MIDSAAQSLFKNLTNNLQAYVSRFETANTPEELAAISSSILRFQQKQGNIAIAPEQYEHLVQQAVQQFNAKDTVNSIVDSTTATLIQDVAQWRQTLENQVLNTLTAYIQNFQPDQELDVPKTVLSIIPLIENTQLRKAEVESLIQKVTSKFDVSTALEQVIGAESVAIAQKLSQLLQFGNIEELLTKSILGDRQLLNQPLENITESFVNKKLAEILGSQALEVNVDLNARQLMVQQVTFKLNAMQSSPPPVKSDAEIALQIDDETQRFLSERQRSLNFNNLFQT